MTTVLSPRLVSFVACLLLAGGGLAHRTLAQDAPAAPTPAPAAAPAPAPPAPAPAEEPAEAVSASDPGSVSESASVSEPASETVSETVSASETETESVSVSASEPVSDGAEPAATTGYDKGFFIASGDGKHELVIGARVQARYTYEAIEGAPNTTQFSIPRARLQLKGHTLTEALTYKFQADFGKGQTSLKDFYADYAFVPSTLHLRVGQWKKPFSRQQITSSGSLQLVERAITDKAFGAGRDIGLALHDDYERSPEFEYAIGLFNGTGETGTIAVSGDVMTDPATGEGTITSATGQASNVPAVFNPTLVARIGYNHGKTDGYSEADFDGGELRFGIGASGLIDFEADHDDDSSVRAEIDYVLKAYHFSSTGGFYVASRQNGPDFGDRAAEAIGAHAQLGYLVAELVEPAFRYEIVDPDDVTNTEQVLSLALSIYPYKHNLKWQTDGSVLLDEAADTMDFRVRSQLQLAF